MLKKTAIFILYLSTLTSIDAENQLENGSQRSQPMMATEIDDRKRQIDTPEVVLQLKYDRGALDRIYLAQFRKEKDNVVPSRNRMCADLCHSGLGGDGCGSPCNDLIPVGLKITLDETFHNSSSVDFGQPRMSVCPILCQNNLGDLLCNCPVSEITVEPNWSAICNAFCGADRYVLAGCPACDQPSYTIQGSMVRNLSTEEGWTAWCNVQCRQGQGGAACNCDRNPFQ